MNFSKYISKATFTGQSQITLENDVICTELFLSIKLNIWHRGILFRNCNHFSIRLSKHSLSLCIKPNSKPYFLSHFKEKNGWKNVIHSLLAKKVATDSCLVINTNSGHHFEFSKCQFSKATKAISYLNFQLQNVFLLLEPETLCNDPNITDVCECPQVQYSLGGWKNNLATELGLPCKQRIYYAMPDLFFNTGVTVACCLGLLMDFFQVRSDFSRLYLFLAKMGLVGNTNDCSRCFIIATVINKHLYLLGAQNDPRHVHQLGLSCILFLFCGKVLAKTSVDLYEFQDFGSNLTSISRFVARKKAWESGGFQDLVLAGIAYAVTTWRIYISSVSAIGVFGIIVGLIAVQTAEIPETKSMPKESAVKQVRQIAKKFFTSSKLLILTIKMVSVSKWKWKTQF